MKPLLYLLQSLLLRGTILLIRTLPYRLSQALGRACGLLAWTCIPLQRGIATTQVRHAIGTPDAKKIARRAYMHQGELIVDTIRFAYMEKHKLKGRILVQGREHIEAALASDHGVMGITGHLNWEMFAHMPYILGFHYSVMGDVIKNPSIQALIEDLRDRCGGFTVLPPKGGMVEMLTKEMKEGRTIGMVIDQRSNRSNKLFCNFLGLPAPTSPAPALIALRGDALVIPIAIFKKNGTYTIRFKEPVAARSFGDDYQDIQNLQEAWQSNAIRQLSDHMQSCVSEPAKEWADQYFWLHSRWLRRSDMKRFLKKGGDFKTTVHNQAQEYGAAYNT